MEYLIFLVLLLYLLPWLLAAGFQHRHEYWILGFVIGLGWTGLGWLAALVWALRGRPRHAPVLYVAGREPPPGPTRRRLHARQLAGGLAATAIVALVGWQQSLPHERRPISGTATLLAAGAAVHGGPGERWPSLGSLEPPCTVHLFEREGGWRRIWRTGGCGGSMSGNSGWLRAAALLREGSGESPEAGAPVPPRSARR